LRQVLRQLFFCVRLSFTLLGVHWWADPQRAGWVEFLGAWRQDYDQIFDKSHVHMLTIGRWPPAYVPEEQIFYWQDPRIPQRSRR
jgi:hypothetical protein